MKHYKIVLTLLIMAALGLYGVMLLSFGGYFASADIEAQHANEAHKKVIEDAIEEKEANAAIKAAREADATQKEDAGVETEPPELIFDLKYTQYLVAAPYTYQAGGEQRSFRFEKMLDAVINAEAEASNSKVTFIDNYKNRNGAAPYYYGKSTDYYGSARGASAPAYIAASTQSEFRYLPDGTLVNVVSEDESFAKVEILCASDGAFYYVPCRYVATDSCLEEITKAIVVDRRFQNIASFEKELYAKEGEMAPKLRWCVVSYSMATTGKTGKYHVPTPLGYFAAIEKKPKFYYYKDGTTTIEGYAPYAIRFSAGGYLHGVSTTYKYAADGSRHDPGMNEYSPSIGTVPLSHKCVRNYTSHAKFMYDWYEQGKTIVIVIE